MGAAAAASRSMYDPILLTLDGSRLSEVALPHAEALAKAFGSRLVVLRVVAPVVGPDDFAYGPSPETYQQMIDAELADAESYVKGKSDEITGRGLAAEGLIRLGEPASTIIDYAQELGAGLIVLATHGRSGIARWVFGSVAERVLRGAAAPVMLVRVSGEDKPGE